MRRAVAVAALAACLTLPSGCRRDWEPSGPSGPLAKDRVMGRYAEQVGPYWRTATFDGAGGVTFTLPEDGRTVTNRGRYWVIGDTVKADFDDPRGFKWALLAVLRGDSLIVCAPRGADVWPFPPLVRVRPVESSNPVRREGRPFSPCYI